MSVIAKVTIPYTWDFPGDNGADLFECSFFYQLRVSYRRCDQDRLLPTDDHVFLVEDKYDDMSHLKKFIEASLRRVVAELNANNCTCSLQEAVVHYGEQPESD